MKLRDDRKFSIGPILKTVGIVGFFTCSILLIVALAYPIYGILPSVFLRDANAVLHAPFYIGIVSTLGFILWGATITICFFSYFFLRRVVPGAKDALFLLCSGLLSLLLLSDDMLQMHEVVYPLIFGIDEKIVYMIYGALTLLYLIYFRDSILRNEYPLLIIALGIFGISMAAEIFLNSLHGQVFIEDGAKFVGIAMWLAYFLQVSFRLISFSNRREDAS
jgi:hypothetical protein